VEHKAGEAFLKQLRGRSAALHIPQGPENRNLRGSGLFAGFSEGLQINTEPEGCKLLILIADELYARNIDFALRVPTCVVFSSQCRTFSNSGCCTVVVVQHAA
jgi:hypothetical protein